MRTLLLYTALFASTLVLGQKEAKDIALTDLMKDLHVTKKSGQNMKQIMWMPKIYWEVSLQDSPYAESGILDEFIAYMDNYGLMLVTNLEITPMGQLEKSAMTVKLKGSDGNIYEPLDQESLPQYFGDMISGIIPMVMGQMGALGDTFEYFIFPTKDANNQLISDVYGENGEIAVIVNDDSLKISLPLSSLTFDKICPTDNKAMSGAWQFCPWHGTKLTNQ
jgi:hypothetical protein